MFPVFRAICVAAPAVPAAVNVTGEPMRLSFVTVNVFDPTDVPSIQLPTVAIPLAFVVTDAPVTEPPPVATTNVMFTPIAGLLNSSTTITLGAVPTAEPAVAD